MKIIINFLAVLIFLVGYHTSYSQYSNKVVRKEAQLAPEWIFKAKKAEKTKNSIIRKFKDGEEKVTALFPLKGFAGFGPVRPLKVYEEDKIFIKFRSSMASNLQPYSGQAQRNIAVKNSSVNHALTLAKVNRLVRTSDHPKLQRLSRIFKGTLDRSITADEAMAILRKLPEVEYVEKVPKYYTFLPPNDPAYGNGDQYALDLVHAVEAFDLQGGSNTVYVAIVDDAFAYDHSDLAANVIVSKCFDVADNDANPRPPTSGENQVGPFKFSHGTHVGGIAGAVTNNNLGIASISNNSVKLFGIKATKDNTDDPSSIDNSFEGVAKAIENGANVINMSFGGAGISQTWQEMIDEATANGVIFVAAAGNGNTSEKNYPAAYNNVIAVSNTDENDEKNASSHFGDWVDIAAPGSDIYSTVVANNGSPDAFAYYTGTSMSSPMVAGLAGLLLSENNALNHDQILNILQSTADNIEAANPGFEGKLGAGRINVYNAMLEAKGISASPTAIFISSGQRIYTGQRAIFSSQSLGNNLNHSWSFPGGSPSAATGKSVSVTYNTPGTYSVTLTVTNGSGSDVVSMPGYITVEDPQECAILNFPFPGTRSFYTYRDNETNKNQGPVVGHNIYEYTKFANKYSYLPGYYISGGLFAVAKVESESPGASKISFKVWDAIRANGIPGNVLASQDVLFKDLVTTRESQSKTNRATYTEVIFDEPAVVPEDGNFFMGFEIYYENGDTVGFFSNEVGEGGEVDSYFFSEVGWTTYSESGFDASIEMSPVLIGSSYVNVPDFVAEGGACAGNSVNFSTEALQNVAAYQWNFAGGTPQTSTEASPTITYNNTGEFEVSLIVTLQNCEVARRKITKTIKVVDCDEAPEADFSVDRFVIAAGDSVNFLEQSKNATGYSWTFEGGLPITAEVANPFVTYPEPGVYEVRLAVQNPNAEVSSMVKEDFIVVLEPDACNFYSESELNSPPPGTPTLYTSDEGYILGTNSSGDLAKVEYFEGLNDEAFLTKLEVYFGEAYTEDSQSAVEFVIYDNNGLNGLPGNLITSKSVNLIDIMEDVENESATEVFFDDEVIEGPFYAGISLDLKNEKDTIALLSSKDDEVTTGTSWEQLLSGAWVPTNERWSSDEGEDPLEISLYVSAFLRSLNHFSSADCTPLSVNEDQENENTKVLVYPNPFEGKTTIAYEVLQAGPVKLEVYNSLGQRVKVLVNEKKTKGNYTIVFDASSLSRGLYIYKLQMGGKRSSGRMVLK